MFFTALFIRLGGFAKDADPPANAWSAANGGQGSQPPARRAYAPEGGEFFLFCWEGRKEKDIRPEVKQNAQQDNYMKMFP